MVREAETAEGADAPTIHAFLLPTANSLLFVELSEAEHHALIVVAEHFGVVRQRLAVRLDEDARNELGVDAREDTFALLGLGHGSDVPVVLELTDRFLPLAAGDLVVVRLGLAKIAVHRLYRLAHTPYVLLAKQRVAHLLRPVVRDECQEVADVVLRHSRLGQVVLLT